MSRPLVLLTLIASVCFGSPAAFQVSERLASSSGDLKDPDAEVLINRTLAVMNSPLNQLQSFDSLSTGTLVMGDQKLPITIKTKGSDRVRVELLKSDGTNVRVLNSGTAVLWQSNGKRRDLIANNTIAERVTHIPAVSLLTEHSNSNVAVALEKKTDGTSPTDSAVALRLHSDDPTQEAVFAKFSKVTFHIDSSTGLVSRLEYTNYAENGDDETTSQVEIVYSDYRSVNGVAVPFRQLTYIDGQLAQELTLDSVRFNVGISESEFSLEGGGK